MEGAPRITVYTNHKNLTSFTTTKILNCQQVRWFELLRQYKFKIQYTPNRENGRVDALNKQSDYIDRKEKIYSVLKINPNRSLSLNTQKFNIIVSILEDTKKQFLILTKKLHIPKK